MGAGWVWAQPGSKAANVDTSFLPLSMSAAEVFDGDRERGCNRSVEPSSPPQGRSRRRFPRRPGGKREGQGVAPQPHARGTKTPARARARLAVYLLDLASTPPQRREVASPGPPEPACGPPGDPRVCSVPHAQASSCLPSRRDRRPLGVVHTATRRVATNRLPRVATSSRVATTSNRPNPAPRQPRREGEDQRARGGVRARRQRVRPPPSARRGRGRSGRVAGRQSVAADVNRDT